MIIPIERGFHKEISLVETRFLDPPVNIKTGEELAISDDNYTVMKNGKAISHGKLIKIDGDLVGKTREELLIMLMSYRESMPRGD